ncbi:MAG: plasmid recombination protein [Eubacteriaceae bacterium]|nr:plasmid recombination protein [Eubacteriaceae bacterium]
MAEDYKLFISNQAFAASSISGHEKHVERTAVAYNNLDIIDGRADKNYYYKRPEASYKNQLDTMYQSGLIDKTGQKKTQNVLNGFVFNMNALYFLEHGGYEGAIKFYKHAYDFAVKEAGGEQFVLSAVMHADELNKTYSTKMKCEVYTYHLHVVFTPVVKKIVHDKDHGAKEVYKISHNQKWANKVKIEGNTRSVEYAYSLLQDRYYEHMSMARLPNIQRGEKGSTIEKLKMLDYKGQQRQKYVDGLEIRAKELEGHIHLLEQAKNSQNKKIPMSYQMIQDGARLSKLSKNEVVVEKKTWDGVLAMAQSYYALSHEFSGMERAVSISKDQLHNAGLLISKLSAQVKELEPVKEKELEKTKEHAELKRGRD